MAEVNLELYKEFLGHKGDINCCAWSPSDQTLCTCSGDKTLRLWNVDEGKEVAPSPISAHRLYVNCVAFSPSGDLLASGSSDTSVKLWSTVSWNVVSKLTGHSGAVRGCAFSPDGCLLASASDDMLVRVWDIGSMKCIATLDKHSSSVTSCSFAPAGWLVVTGSSSGDIILFDCFKKTPVAKILRADELGVNSLQVSPKSVASENIFTFACVGGDGLVRLWTVTINNKRVSVHKSAELSAHNAGVFSCSFSADGKYLASGDADKYVMIWDLESLTPVVRLQPHSRYITHVSFSLDGRYLATASNDKTIKLWKVHHGLHQLSEKADQPLKPVPIASPSKISTEEWDVDQVCVWLEAVATEQNRGTAVHPDDLRAAHRVSRALESIAFEPKTSDHLTIGDFHCPITQEVMRDPVVAADGFSYERSAITGWFSKGRMTSPSTNLPLPNTLLVPNKHLKILIDKRPK